MTKVRPFDVAAYLDSPEMIAAYVNEALEAGDPSAIFDAIGAIVRSRGKGAIAAKATLFEQAIDRAFDGEASPQFGVILAVLDALEVRLVARPLHSSTI